MKLNYEIYKDKVAACWIGKNIGGTMGGPYEGVRDVLDIKGFKTKPKEPLPNDDLDLQLIWLHAIETEGPRNITAETLGEYWLSFIAACPNEYGITKSNMMRGMYPSISGGMENNAEWKTSNGAWIRTEIWATLCPGMPDIAVRYAIEDAKVDHGMGEGAYAAMFVAAIESAAFVVDDVRTLIEIGLAKIPQDSRMAQSIQLLLQCYDEGKTWLEARNAILEANADIGDGWFQAPSNVAYAVLGILYGGGDFKKSMLTAINCGDDTDCTAATVGSILGIMHGSAGIPEDWREHIGDAIITCCINLGVCWRRITSCIQLTERVTKYAPYVLAANDVGADQRKYKVEFTDGETEIDENIVEKYKLAYGKSEESDAMRRSMATLKPNTFAIRGGAVTLVVDYNGEATLLPGEERTLYFTVLNNNKAFGNQPYTVNIKLILPEGFSAEHTEFDVFAPHWMSITNDSCSSKPVAVKIKAGETLAAVNTLFVQFKVTGRYIIETIPVTFLNRLG